MVNFKNVYPTLPTTNLDVARHFYEGTLGLTVVNEVGGGIVFKAGDSELFVYQRGPAASEHTLAGFRVDDIEATIDDLTAKGVQFEHYDYPTLKTDEKGIATTPPIKAAWFKDPDGNTLGITQMME